MGEKKPMKHTTKAGIKRWKSVKNTNRNKCNKENKKKKKADKKVLNTKTMQRSHIIKQPVSQPTNQPNDQTICVQQHQ